MANNFDKFTCFFSQQQLQMLQKQLLLYISIFLLLFTNCKEDKGIKRPLPTTIETSLNIEYAKGFSIKNNKNFKVLTITNPWPKAEKNYRYALITKENAAKTTLNKDEFDGIITIPVKHIVVTSTTHIPALELLNEVETLVGFPGTDYVSSIKTRHRIDEGLVRELGKNEGLNTEVLLSI
ncbi:MAG: hypothetical protein JXK08_02100, partial [Flavobacteriaceae bacterium]|nr:hypothetical protein [Flavobacteriaceae bacterium]